MAQPDSGVPAEVVPAMPLRRRVLPPEGREERPPEVQLQPTGLQPQVVDCKQSNLTVVGSRLGKSLLTSPFWFLV